MLMVLTTVFAGCAGSDNNGAKTNARSKTATKQIGGSIPVSTAGDNQLNPQVVYLADKNLYFSVWEDYRNRNTFGSDIYGQFINPDGTLCSSPFAIITASGDQTVPQVAYRQDKSFGDSKLVVTWQDSKGTDISGYLSYASVTNLPQFDTQTNTCKDTNIQKIDGPFDVGFTPIKTYSYSILPQPPGTISMTYNNGLVGAGSVKLNPNVVPGTINVTGTYHITDGLGTLSTVSLTDDSLGKLVGSGASGTISYQSGNLDLTLANGVQLGTTAVLTVNYSSFTGDLVDTSKLLSRKSPKISYDSARDEFWLAWIESRDVNNIFSTTCWGLPITWRAGDSTFAGYLRLKASDLSKIQNGNGVQEADLLRNQETSTARLITSSADATTITLTYEYFTAINNVSIASDSSSPETLFAWEGNRQKGTLACKLDPATGIITSTFSSGSYDDGLVHIYGLFDKEILLPSTGSKIISTGAGSNPTIAVDDASAPRKFLVAWEDNLGGLNTRIYGQLLYSGGSIYKSNMQISNAITAQDTAFASSQQTRPTALFDAVNQRYFVTWQDSRNGATSSGNMDIYGQNIDLQGSFSGGNFVIATNIANQLAPAIAYDTLTKQFLYVWKGGESTTSFSDIYGQLYSVSNSQIVLLNMDNTPLTPTLLDFKTVSVGISTYKSFKVRNTGIAPLTIESVSIPAASVFSVTPVIDSTKPSILPPGSELTITVTYTPVDGTSSASVLIKSDAADVTVDLNGLGVAPVLTSSVTSLGFTSTDVGQSQTGNLRLTNSGTIDVTLNSLSGLSGTGPFSLGNVPALTFPQTITAGNSLELFILFAPTEMGSFNSTINILTNNSSTNQTISLSGSGIKPLLSTDLTTDPLTGITPLNFGSTSVGNTIQKTFNIKNSGNKLMTVNSLTVSGSSAFSVKSTIKTPLLFAAGESLDVPLLFSPTTYGAYTGTLTLVSDGGNQTVALQGQGTAGVLNVSPSQIDFGTTALNNTVTKAVTITNSGNAPLNISGITSPTNSVFTTSYIGSLPVQILPNTSFTVTVKFKSGNVGLSQSNFTVNTDASNGNQTINLQAVTSSLAISNVTLPAGILGTDYNQTLVATGGVQPYTWTLVTPNGGALPTGLTLAPNTGIISGTPSAAGNYVFIAQVTDVNGLAATQTLSINVTSAGTASSTVIFTDAGGTQLPNAPYSFGSEFRGLSVSRTLKVLNNGLSPVIFSGASILKQTTGTAPELSYTTTFPTTQTTLAPNSSITFDISFIPKSAATYPAVLVLSDISGGTYSLPLTGTGTPVDVTLDTTTQPNAVVSSYGTLTSQQYSTNNKPANFTISKAVDFVMTGVSAGGTVTCSVTFDTLPTNSVFYKVVGNTWTPFTPDTVSGNTITYRVKDNDPTMDSDPRDGFIHDPIVAGSTSSTGGASTTSPPPSSGGGGGGGCFIATAAFGSYLDPHVMVLRNFRDNVLLKSELGTEFVKFYYRHSPPIADFIARHPVLKLATRFALTPVIFAVKYPVIFLGLLIGLMGALSRIKSPFFKRHKREMIITG
jgi:hypothetical protein